MGKLALLVVLVLGCGSVTPKASDDGAAGAGGELATGGTGGELATGGAGGRLLGTGGALAGSGGQLGTGGAAGGALTAPACKGNFVGSLQPCPRIPAPDGGATANGSWQCEVACSDDKAEDATGCTFYGVTYCVPSCSECRL